MESPAEILNILNEPIGVQEKADRLNRFAIEIRNQKPKLSFKCAEKALELSSEAKYLKGEADSFMSIGFYFMHAAEQEKAFTYLFKSVSIYGEIGDEKGIADTHYFLGILHIRVGNFSEAVEMLHKSLAYREKVQDLSGMAACYFQLSFIAQNFDDVEGAFDAANKSLQLRKELNDNVGQAAAYMVLGEVYLRKNDLPNAKIALEQSLELRKTSPEKMGYFATLLPLTELHIRLEEFDKAFAFAMQGLEMSRGEEISFGVIRFMQVLGKLEFALKNYDAAKIRYTEALNYTQKFSYKSIDFEIHQALAEICKLKMDYKGALEHYEKYLQLKEEVLNFQTNTRMKSVQLISQIEFAQKEAQLEKTKNIELNEAYKVISEKNKEITDSINYAKRIQYGILPSDAELKNILGNHFVLYKPKDIVSGDFYWCISTQTSTTNRKLHIIAAVDCTGHGVPGAFMSMLGRTLLNQTIKHPQINSPADVLDFLNQELPKNLKSHQVESSIHDGMDIALCAIDFDNMKLHFAGANNLCWIVRKKEFFQLKGDKQAISASSAVEKKPFTNQTFDLQKGDCIYLCTDGYADQFGGPRGKKFKYKALQELILANANQPIEMQKEILEEHFENWKGCLEQVDDVTVIGVVIND